MYKKLARNSKLTKTELFELTFDHWEMSTKMKVLINFLSTWNTENISNAKKDKDITPHKILIFSQTKKSLYTLEKLAD